MASAPKGDSNTKEDIKSTPHSLPCKACKKNPRQGDDFCGKCYFEYGKRECYVCGIVGKTISRYDFKGKVYCGAECWKRRWSPHRAGVVGTGSPERNLKHACLACNKKSSTRFPHNICSMVCATINPPLYRWPDVDAYANYHAK